MEIKNKILIYQSQEGQAPFEDWLHSLRDRKAAGKVKIRIDRVRLGNFGQHRSVEHGVHELKIDYGPGYRVYFAQEGKTIVLLLCGGDKSTQGRDIRKAHEYWTDYKNRKGA